MKNSNKDGPTDTPMNGLTYNKTTAYLDLKTTSRFGGPKDMVFFSEKYLFSERSICKVSAFLAKYFMSKKSKTRKKCIRNLGREL